MSRNSKWKAHQSLDSISSEPVNGPETIKLETISVPDPAESTLTLEDISNENPQVELDVKPIKKVKKVAE